MPNIKLTQMSVAVSLQAADYFMVVQGGANKKITTTTILKNLDSSDSIRVNPLQNAIDFSVASKNDASMLVIKGASDRFGIGTDNPQSKLHIVGNAQIGSTSIDGVLLQSSEELTYTSSDQTIAAVKSVSPMRTITQLNCNTGVSGLFSLSTGFNGEVKTIFQNTLDVGKTSTISLTGLGFNTVTFDTVGESVILQFVSSISKWIILGNNNASFSTV